MEAAVQMTQGDSEAKEITEVMEGKEMVKMAG